MARGCSARSTSTVSRAELRLQRRQRRAALRGSEAAPVLLGIVSWGSDFCGADHTPSVFAEVDRYRSFITDASPVWAPTSAGMPEATRHGSRMTCTPPAFDALPDRVEYTWHRAGYTKAIGHGRAFRPGRDVRRHRVACRIEASNAGGEILRALTAG